MVAIGFFMGILGVTAFVFEKFPILYTKLDNFWNKAEDFMDGFNEID